MGADLTTVHSVVGQGAASITVIRKNGTGNAYAASLFEVTALARLVAAAGARYEVGAVMLTHGEADAELASYEDDVALLAADYEADLQAITGQTAPIPMILSQQHPDPVRRRLDVDAGDPVEGRRRSPGKHSFARGRSTSDAYGGRSHAPARGGQYDRLGIKYRAGVLRAVVRGRRLAAAATDRGRARRSDDQRSISRAGAAAARGTRRSCAAPFVHAEWKNGRGFEVQDGIGEMDDHRRADRRRHGAPLARPRPGHDGGSAGRARRDDPGRDPAGGWPRERSLRPVARRRSAGRRRRRRD